ncbi:MAG: hypothetical protein K2N28_06525 [Muribaculaceae bacterium]|nr:hypothetical protein [Muribaculaceae bacterium]
MKLKLFYFVLMTVCSLNQAFGAGSNACEPVNNDTLQFVLKNGYIIQWINAKRDVVTSWDGDKFASFNRSKKIRLSSMFEQIGDTTNLNIYVPYKKTGPLRKGDLVFILLMHGPHIPIVELYGRYLHWFDRTCPIPGDVLLDWLEEDRENIVRKLREKYRDDTSLFSE